MHRIFSALWFLVLGAASLNASAALIQHDWKTSGDSSIIFDDVSKLEWLDLDQTAGNNYYDLENMLAVGGSLQGFRFASLIEVQDLLANQDIAWGLCYFSVRCESEANLIDQLVRIMGPASGITSTVSYMTGYVLSDAKSNFSHSVRVRAALDAPYFSTVELLTGDKSRGGFSFLVRTASVPEPSTLVLLLVSLLSVAVFRRRRAI